MISGIAILNPCALLVPSHVRQSSAIARPVRRVNTASGPESMNIVFTEMVFCKSRDSHSMIFSILPTPSVVWRSRRDHRMYPRHPIVQTSVAASSLWKTPPSPHFPPVSSWHILQAQPPWFWPRSSIDSPTPAAIQSSASSNTSTFNPTPIISNKTGTTSASRSCLKNLI